MNVPELPATWSGVLCGLIFLATLLAGDVAGLFIERKWKRRWQAVANRMGFEFYGRRSRWPSLSSFLLPKLLLHGTKESAFCYGEALKTLRGSVAGFDVTITDFAVWNFYSRSSLVFRAPVLLFKKQGSAPLDVMATVKDRSFLLHGVRLDPSMREYHFSYDKDFSKGFHFFGSPLVTPWNFTADLRNLFVEFRKDIDSVFVDGEDLLVICKDRIPERFRKLVEFGITVLGDLVENAQGDRPQSQMA